MLLADHKLRARALSERLGRALIFAGRGSEAAAVFVELLPGATPAEALTLRTLATTQLLRDGQLVEGFKLRDAEPAATCSPRRRFATHCNCWVGLAIDRPELADQQVDIAESEWTPRRAPDPAHASVRQ